MKILLATDGSAHSKIVLEKVAGRPYPPNTEVRIISAYQSTPLISSIEPMGVSQEYYAKTDRYVLKAAEKISKNAAEILHKKNPALTITTTVIDGSPKSVILKEAERFGADLIVVGSHGSGAVKPFCWARFPRRLHYMQNALWKLYVNKILGQQRKLKTGQQRN